jgi:hypothetical protein
VKSVTYIENEQGWRYARMNRGVFHNHQENGLHPGSTSAKRHWTLTLTMKSKLPHASYKLERVPRGFLAACARHSCGFLQDTLLLLPDALFACSGAFHGDTASFESRHFVSSLQHYYQTLWRHAQSIWLLRKVLQTVRHVLSELCNCLLPAKSSLSSASSAS